MYYKSIATVLHNPTAHHETLELAISAARKWDAHLHIVCIGVDRTEPGFYYAGAHAIAIQSNLEFAQDQASELEQSVRNRLSSEDIAWDVEAVTTLATGLEPYVADHLRFFDLVILPLPLATTADRIDELIFDGCIFGADRPVLAVPNGFKGSCEFKRVLMAWNDGLEALAACREALPLITTARECDISIIDPPVHGPERSDPGGRLAQFLARWGARAEINVLARTHSTLADQLSSRAVETGADVIVMGAYGHSRLREAVLGGVTRDMLQRASLPVFMAH